MALEAVDGRFGERRVARAQLIGHSVNAYRVLGNLDNALLVPKFDVTAVSADDLFRFLPERLMAGDAARPAPAALPDWFKFEIVPDSNTGGKFFVADAISSPHGTFGIETFVSDRAREALEPKLATQAKFLPVVIENASTPYYALWVTRVMDALDPRRAKLTELTYLRPKTGSIHPLRLDRYVFKPESIEGVHLFRLPGRQLAEQSMNDFATDKFVALARELGLSGFQYFSAITEPAFLPHA